MGIRLFRKIKELSPFASQTRGSDSSCLSHELVSGDVAFSLHLPQQGPRGPEAMASVSAASWDVIQPWRFV